MADATAAALKALQEQASSAAAALGLKVGYIKDVQLQPDMPWLIGSSGAGMMSSSRAGTPPPRETASPQDVSIYASAEVVLER